MIDHRLQLKEFPRSSRFTYSLLGILIRKNLVPLIKVQVDEKALLFGDVLRPPSLSVEIPEEIQPGPCAGCKLKQLERCESGTKPAEITSL